MRVFFLLLLLFSYLQAQPILTGYQYQMDLGNLQTDGHVSAPTYFHIYYTINPPNISIGVVADTTTAIGWAGFGITNTNLMIPGDAVIAHVDTGPRINDFFLVGRVASLSPVFCNNGIAAVCFDPTEKPAGNCQDNVYNTTVSRISNFLTFTYTRPLAASDACDLAITPGVPVGIIFGVGPTIASSAWPYSIQYHYVRGISNMTFLLSPVTTGVATTAVATTGSAATTASVTTAAATTAVATTGFSTTGAIVNPPTLTGFANQLDLSNSLTDGFMNVVKYYMFYYTILGPTINIGMVCLSPDGWCAFGWSPSGQMQTAPQPSDAVVCSINPGTGQLQISDFDLIGRSAPDPVQCNSSSTSFVCPDVSRPGCADNTFASSGMRIGNYLMCSFSRPIIASDTCDVAITPGTAQYLIFSLGPTTGSGIFPYNIQFHTAHTNVTFPYTFIASPLPSSSAIPATSVATTTCPIGMLGCPCTSGGGCNPGLACSASLICVMKASAASSLVIPLVLMAVLLFLFV